LILDKCEDKDKDKLNGARANNGKFLILLDYERCMYSEETKRTTSKPQLWISQKPTHVVEEYLKGSRRRWKGVISHCGRGV
jgi:hypothetical protein